MMESLSRFWRVSVREYLSLRLSRSIFGCNCNQKPGNFFPLRDSAVVSGLYAHLRKFREAAECVFFATELPAGAVL
jgi:hypothetical protein